MAKNDTPNADARGTKAEGQLDAIKMSLSVLTQAINDLRVSRMQSGLSVPAFPFTPGFQQAPFGAPLLLIAPFASPATFSNAGVGTYPPQEIDGTCGTSKAVVSVPGPGNYQLSINVAGESRCAVNVSAPDAGVNFGTVQPGDSLLTPVFTFFTPTIIAQCQGSGGDCIASVTLIKVS